MLEIDKKDIAIIQALDQNVRASYVQIGRKTKIGKETVQYRIKNLEKKKIITGYWIIPKLCNKTTVYKILLKNKNMNKEEKEKFISYLSHNTFVSWFASTEGNWDYIITSVVSKDHYFSEMMTELLNKFGSKFKEKHIIKGTEIISTNEKYLYSNKHEIISNRASLLQESTVPDNIDNQIIQELSLNARTSFRDIAQKINLTSEAVAYRYKKVVKEHILTMKPRIDHSKLGYTYYHLYIELTDPSMYKKIADYYTIHPQCVFIMKYLGVCDLHLELVLDPNKTQDIIDELITQFGNSLNGYELIKIKKEYVINVH
ncbi:MAG: Lrp/AsnC family transcriptional regulator [Candidatus Nanoarchaeia archaeon]